MIVRGIYQPLGNFGLRVAAWIPASIPIKFLHHYRVYGRSSAKARPSRSQISCCPHLHCLLKPILVTFR